MKNDVTVVAVDKYVSVDNVGFKIDKLVLADGHECLWALQWHGQSGLLEFKDSSSISFEESEYDKNVLPYVAQWEAEKARREAEFEAEWNKPENVEARARARRNSLLKETDYLLMPDYPLTEELRAAWTAYRQALRDLPEQEGWPTDVIWPEKPDS